MQENEKKIVTWDDLERSLASEIINGAKIKSKILGFGLACVTVMGVASAGFLAHINHQQTVTLYENDKEWREAIDRSNQRWIEYLSQYDFVSQDGEGYNYYNSDVGGDVVNGAENPQEAE